MLDMEPRRILVAVDSTSEAALGCAVAEARRGGCGLHLVHINDPRPTTTSWSKSSG